MQQTARLERHAGAQSAELVGQLHRQLARRRHHERKDAKRVGRQQLRTDRPGLSVQLPGQLECQRCARAGTRMPRRGRNPQWLNGQGHSNQQHWTQLELRVGSTDSEHPDICLHGDTWGIRMCTPGSIKCDIFMAHP
jgi:hypothetical protein